MSDQRPLTPQEISQGYDRVARWYDWIEGIPDLLGVRRLRRELLQRASGRVLEVAVGTGKNFPYYSRDCRVVALDLSKEMLNVARERAAKLSLDATFLVADAEALPFSDQSFDTVVSSFSTCTFPDPVAALKEMERVCRPGGKVLLLEHGRSDRDWLGRWQDRHADQFAKPLGCNWNRDALQLVHKTSLRVHSAKRHFLGIFQWIESLKIAPYP
jgi:ubiquinone/menaquinone biosynthesis C-methylase UbiE